MSHVPAIPELTTNTTTEDFNEEELADTKPCVDSHHVKNWCDANPLTPIEVDCVTAVMLKILDNKCKMTNADKIVMELLYDQTKSQRGACLGGDIHQLIAISRLRIGEQTWSEELLNFIYEKRVLAETAISRPVMKRFKAMIRQTGLFDV